MKPGGRNNETTSKTIRNDIKNQRNTPLIVACLLQDVWVGNDDAQVHIHGADEPTLQLELAELDGLDAVQRQHKVLDLALAQRLALRS